MPLHTQNKGLTTLQNNVRIVLIKQKTLQSDELKMNHREMKTSIESELLVKKCQRNRPHVLK